MEKTKEVLFKNRDINLYSSIHSQTTDEDKYSLLTLINWKRQTSKNYCYLEIGSHLGGTIQPFLIDTNCTTIYSIDKRPEFQPDERGVDFYYENNSTKRMMKLLKKVSKFTYKIICIDKSTQDIKPSEIIIKPNLCFIDGEHTDKAALNDFKFCLKVLEKKGTIVFHDANIVFKGISKAIKYLDEEGLSYKAFNLPDSLFLISFDLKILKNKEVSERVHDNYKAYLFGLNTMSKYREFIIKHKFQI